MKKRSKTLSFWKKKELFKILITMKISLMFILLTALQVNASVYSQNMKFTMKMKNTTVKEVFSEIEENSEFRFFYNDALLNLNERVSINAKNIGVEEILGNILDNTKLSYRVLDDNLIVITPSNELKQQLTVKGKVTSATDGTPIPGVNVIEKGTTNGAVTNLDGNFSINVQGPEAVLVFSFIGFLDEEITVGVQTTIDVDLVEDITKLDEVVVIGYGTAKKSDLTGSIVNVQAEDLERYQPSSVSAMLRAAVPGLKVGYSTSAKNTPDFEIRGDITIKADKDDDIDEEKEANKPLIVLDGIIFNGDLAEINVNDIESVDVLKDASAASIYGSRASNGVIVFTTKKGIMGKPVVRLSAKTGWVTSAKRIETFKGGDEVTTWLTDMNESINSLSTEPWSKYDKYENVPSEYQSDWLDANGVPGATDPTVITTAWLDAFGFETNEKENYLAGNVYDWQDFLFHTGRRNDYDLSVSGRTEKISYYWSLGYVESESVQIGEKFTTVTSRLNLDVAATDFLNVGIMANFAYQDEGQEAIDNGGYRTASPYDMPWENGMPHTREYLKTAGAGSNRGNPYLDPAYKERKYDRYKLFPTMYAKLHLPFGITFTSNLTTRLDFRKRFNYEDGSHPRWGHGGKIRRQLNQTFEWQSDNILNWEKEFGAHRFAVTGLVNAERNQMWYTDANTSNLSPTEALGYHAMAFGLNPTTASNDEVIARNALMGRINYTFGNRYHISASMRRDGYSRFGSDNVYATFPSVSAAWTVSSESFMAGAPSWLTFLKLRASWGVNGNSSGLGAYQAYARLSDNKYLNWNGGYYATPYMYINRMANPTLAWEKNDALNFGLDYGFWNGRVRGALDIYSSETTDLLLDKKLPIVTGFEDITTNVGNLKNTGFDFSLNTVNIQGTNFVWSSSLNASYNRSEIVSLTGEKVEMVDANGNTYMGEPDDFQNGWFIGESKDVIWDYEIDGVYSTDEADEAALYNLYPGDFRVVDQNGDGVLNIDDKVFQGLKKNPWYLTLRNEVEYRGFDLGVVLLAKLGYQGGTNYPFNERQDYIKNHNWFNLPYWTPNNQIDDAARINSIRLTDMNIWVPKSYLRVQNIALGYNLPSSILTPIKVSRARISFNIDNAAVFTEWIMGDPESEREMPRTYTLSLDFSF